MACRVFRDIAIGNIEAPELETVNVEVFLYTLPTIKDPE